MLKNILISILGLSLFVGCGLMNDSKSDSSNNSPEAGKEVGEELARPTAATEIINERVNDIEILAHELTFIPNLLEEIEREPNIFIKDKSLIKLDKRYSFDNYTLLSGELELGIDSIMTLNMRLLDNRYSVTKEYLNYKFNFVDGDEKSLSLISGQEVINNHTFLAVSADQNQTPMKFDLMNNLLIGGVFSYINEESSKVIFKSVDTNKIEILIDRDLNGIFEDSEKIEIIVGES